MLMPWASLVAHFSRLNLHTSDRLTFSLNNLGLVAKPFATSIYMRFERRTSFPTSLPMELFQPFFVHNPMKSIRRTRTSGDKPIQDDHPCPPLIKLLAIVTALDVNIFPLTWRPALEVLGEGLTGSVSQSPLNAQVAFAFKRFNPLSANVPGCSDAAWLSSGYDALLSEIIALSSSKIYDHPNVVNLEGLCWEIRRDSEEVWPVLVFRKADLGSLDKFLSFSSADWLSFDNLMAIAGDVAKGLLAFHDCSKLSVQQG